jgi:acylphosphatase
MPDSELQTLLLRIHGRVQGVGYRMWAKHTAEQCRITGWVRNRSDDSVELLAHGYEDDMERFIAECYKGPAMAQVKAIHTSPGVDEEMRDFRIRDTK